MVAQRNLPHLVVDAETSARMGNIRQHGTTPELVVRSLARRLGLHFRVGNRDLPGSPDLANRKRRWAVFVHGCYWHRHPGCVKTTTPTRNRDFWVAKFSTNVERDRRVANELRAMGFRVVVIWECETLNASRAEGLLAQLAVESGRDLERKRVARRR